MIYTELTVLYENYGAVAWNGWSGRFVHLRVTPKAKTGCFELPSWHYP